MASVLYLASGVLAYLPLWLAAPYRPRAIPFLLGLALPFFLLWLCRGEARAGRLSMGWLLAVALAVRLGFWLQPPSLSEDVQRYFWDGALVASGENPYRSPPADLPLVRSERAGLYSRMAHRDRLSVYPPLAQAAFALNWVLWKDSMAGWRFFLLLAEAGLAIVLLKGFRAPAERMSLWLLHPLVVVEFYSSGHLDVLALAPLAAALAFALKPGRGPASAAGVALSAAALVKVFPAFFLPLAMGRGGRGRGGVLAAAFLLGVAVLAAPLILWPGPPLESVQRLTGALSGFHEQWRFNSLPFFLFRPQRRLLGWICTGLFLAVIAGLTAARPPSSAGASAKQDLLTRCYFLLAALYALAHTVHPWYTTWILLFYPLLGLRYRAGFWLASASSVSYLAYASDPAAERLWWLCLQYLPYYLLLLSDLRAYHQWRNGPQTLLCDRQAGR